MTLNEYQVKVCRDTGEGGGAHALSYRTLALVGETGDVAMVVSKGANDRVVLALELGDVLREVGVLARVAGFTLDDVARMNLYRRRKWNE